jgi:pimeloyl-ACP methyl ester carboxylesterase
VALAADPAFRTEMLAVLAECLGRGTATYRAEMALYVADWSAELADVTQPVRLFHGRADNWAPVGMAEALAERLPNVADVEVLEGASHYSMLKRFLSRDLPGEAPA